MSLYTASFVTYPEVAYHELYSALNNLNAVEIIPNIWSFYSEDNVTGLGMFFSKFFTNGESLFINEVKSWSCLNTNDQPFPNEVNNVITLALSSSQNN